MAAMMLLKMEAKTAENEELRSQLEAVSAGSAAEIEARRCVVLSSSHGWFFCHSGIGVVPCGPGPPYASPQRRPRHHLSERFAPPSPILDPNTARRSSAGHQLCIPQHKGNLLSFCHCLAFHPQRFSLARNHVGAPLLPTSGDSGGSGTPGPGPGRPRAPPPPSCVETLGFNRWSWNHNSKLGRRFPH